MCVLIILMLLWLPLRRIKSACRAIPTIACTFCLLTLNVSTDRMSVLVLVKLIARQLNETQTQMYLGSSPQEKACGLLS